MQEQEDKLTGSIIYHSNGSIEEQTFKNGKFLSSIIREYMPNGAYVTTTMTIGKISQIVCF